MAILGGPEDQEDEVLEDATDIPHYITPSRSFSRLRIDSHRVCFKTLIRINTWAVENRHHKIELEHFEHYSLFKNLESVRFFSTGSLSYVHLVCILHWIYIESCLFWYILKCHLFLWCKAERVSSPQNENCVINYSPSCRSKPVRPSFIFRTWIKKFLMKSEISP